MTDLTAVFSEFEMHWRPPRPWENDNGMEMCHPAAIHIRELPLMMTAKFLDFLTPSPLSAFGTDL